MIIRARQARLLVRSLLRTVPLVPLAAAAACGALALSLEGDVVFLLRLAAVALCTGAAFALDDPAAVTTASTPTPLLFRRLLRVALMAPLVVAIWALLLAYAGESVRTALTLELAAMLAVTLAVAALATPHMADGRGGLAAGPALLALMAVAALAVPGRWTLLAKAGDPRWAASHVRWGFVLALAVGAVVYASLDPGRHRRVRRLLDRRREPIRVADATE